MIRTIPSVPEPQSVPRNGSWMGYKRKWSRSLLRKFDYGVYSEIETYLADIEAQEPVDCHEALRNQSLPTSADLGMAPWDSMKELDTIPARVAFLNQLTEQVCKNGSSIPSGGIRVAAFGVWNGNMWGLRRSLLPWMQWHTHLGLCRYYIAYQGRDTETFRWLQRIRSLSLILISPPFATPELNARWRAFAAEHEWGRKPGNWRLMAKQGFAGDLAIEQAQRDGVQWFMHIDADELVLPATSLAADLRAAPSWAAGLKMHNHEALVEAFEVTNKYEEVTLFKTHDATLPERAGDLQWQLRLGTHGATYQVYHNGKSVVRTDRAHVHMWGPHEFLGPVNDTWHHPEHNPDGEFKSVPSKLTLLHVSYTSWHDLVGKAKTSCPREYREAAVAGNRTKVEECFCLGFDLNAYMAAAKGDQAARDYWVINSLFSEGAVRKDGEAGCRVYRDVAKLKELMVRDRLLLRVLAPQQVLRSQEVAIRAVATSMGIKPESGAASAGTAAAAKGTNGPAGGVRPGQLPKGQQIDGGTVTAATVSKAGATSGGPGGEGVGAGGVQVSRHRRRR